jgi:hypothetical protein
VFVIRENAAYGPAEEIAWVINNKKGENIRNPDAREGNEFIGTQKNGQGENYQNMQTQQRSPGDK